MSKEKSGAWAGKGCVFLSAVVAVAIVTGCMFLAKSQRGDREGDDGKVSSPLVLQQGQSIAASGEGRLFAGPLHTCMLLGNGALKCWGDNSGFELGVGSGGGSDVRGDEPNELGNFLPAVQLPTGLSVRSIAAGLSNTCALLSDSTVRCWGTNDTGELGVASAAPTDVVGDQAGELGNALAAVPLGRPVRAIAAGYYSYCAILDTGDVKCWGDNRNGELGVGDVNPRGGTPGDFATLPRVELGTNRHAVAIAGGYLHFCAILDNGSVKCWGGNGSGQLGIGSTVPVGGSPTDLGDNLPAVQLGTGRTAVQIAAGPFHTCARLDDGSAKCWGSNQWGQLGLGDNMARGDGVGPMGDDLPAVNVGAGLTVRSIAAGATHTCMLLSNGQVKCWGNNAPSVGILGLERSDQQLGDTPQTTPDQLGFVNLGTLRSVRAISAGYAHTCAWLDDGSIKCWGHNGYGQLGIGTRTNRGASVGTMGDRLPPAYLKEAICASSFSASTCSLLDGGSLKCWGYNATGQLGLGDTVQRGSGTGQMGANLSAVSVGGGRTTKSVSIGFAHACAILDDGSVACWGANGQGQLGIDSTTSTTAPGTTAILGAAKAIQIGVGYQHSCALFDDASVKCWGWNAQGQIGVGSTATAVGNGPAQMESLASVALGGPAKAISVGYEHTCALLTDGTVKCWGSNIAGELGLGDATNRNSPQSSPVDLGGTPALAVSAGGNFTCVLLQGGTVDCWGYGANGRLGTGNTNNVGDATGEMGANLRAVPLVGEPVALSTGAGHACALMGDATVKCWGYNADGELGLSSTADVGDSPTEIANLPPGGVPLGTSVSPVSVVLGWIHSCVLLSDGTRKCWGGNNFGQLGLGSTVSWGGTGSVLGDNLPTIKLGINRPAIAVASGDLNTCAILENGPVKCWGDNTFGQLGQGDTTARGTSASLLGDALLPVALGTGRSARQIAIAGGHACAVLDNGAVKCWGKNADGQLGVGDTLPRGTAGNQMSDELSAVQLTPGQSAVSVAVGANHSCALLTNGTVQCWGKNQRGQLGQGSTTSVGSAPGQMGINLKPVDLGAGRTARAIAATDDYTCALLDSGRVKCWGANDLGDLGVGDTVDRGTANGQMGVNLPSIDLGNDPVTSQARGSVGLVPNCALLDDSTVKCWGDNGHGQLGLGNTTSLGASPSDMGELLPRVAFAPHTVVALSSVRMNRCALLDYGGLRCWGDNSKGQLGLETNVGADTGTVAAPVLPDVSLGMNRTAVQFSVGNLNTCAVVDSGAVKCWGDNSAGQLGRGDTVAMWGNQMGQMGPGLQSAAVGDTTICGGLPCNLTPQCAGPMNLDDGNPCTNDFCSLDLGPQHVPNTGASCNDNNPATQGDICDSHGVCAGTVAPLDDNNPCTHDVNVGGTPTHDPEASGFPCGTGSVCNGGGTCVPASSIPAPPEDPAQYAPVTQTIGMSFEHRYSFLYSGPHAVQSQDGSTPLQLDPNRVSVVRGSTFDSMGRPLPSVAVRVQNHPELGTTLSRADGAFDLAVNGGGSLNLVYERPGFFPIHRRIKPRWNEVKPVDPVTFTPPDAQYNEAGVAVAPTAPIKITPCTGTCPLVVVRGRSVTDNAGTRRITVMMPSDAVASVNGQALPSMTIRATEFTDGTRGGPSAMPAESPFGVTYTYAAELSLDEVPNPNAQISFSKNVPVYIDNYRQIATSMPDGSIRNVPLGYYDRTKGAWVPENSGRVVEIESISGGEAQVDVSGDHVADAGTDTTTGTGAATLDLSRAERQKLGSLYASVTLPYSLLRLSVRHFSSHDPNYYGVPSSCANGGTCSSDKVGGVQKPTTGCQSQQNGSIIECQARSVGERVDVAGTPFTLNYRSRRAPGYVAERTASFTFPDCTAGPRSTRTSMCAEENGTLSCQPGPGCGFGQSIVNLVLNGADPFGHPRLGSMTVPVFTAETYHINLGDSGRYGDLPSGATFGRGPAANCVGTPNPLMPPWAQDCTFSVFRTIPVPAYFYDARTFGMGGWTLSVHHDFDSAAGVLELGTGERILVKGVDGRWVHKLVNPLAPASDQFDFQKLMALTSGPDGSLYYLDPSGTVLTRLMPDRVTAFNVTASPLSTYGRRIKVDNDGSVVVATVTQILRVTPDSTGRNGTVQTVVGPSTGLPAPMDTFSSIYDVALADDGTMYIADLLANRIYRRDTSGTVTLFAGNGDSSQGQNGHPYGDGDFALDAEVPAPANLALAPDGSLYVENKANIVNGESYSIRHITADGRINTVVPPDDNVNGSLNFQNMLEVDSVGRVYYLYGDQIKYLDTDGTSHVALGRGGDTTQSQSDIPATLAGTHPLRFTLLPDDTLVVNETEGELRRVAPFDITGQPGCAALVPSQDMTEAYCFDADGKHVETVDANTRLPIRTFSYDDSGLRFVTDANGNQTEIQWSAPGKPSKIIGPFGQTTTFSLDSDGYIARIDNPDGTSESMSYAQAGLLQQFRDSRNFTSSYSYDPKTGEFLSETLPNGGTQTMSETLSANPAAGTDQTSTFKSALANVTTGTKKNPTVYKTTSATANDQMVKVTTTTDGVKTSFRQTSDGAVVTQTQDGTTETLSNDKSDPRFEAAGAYKGTRDIAITRAPTFATGVPSQSSFHYIETRVRSQTDGPPSAHSESVTVTGNSSASTVNYVDGVAGAPPSAVITSAAGRTVTLSFDLQNRIDTISAPRVGGGSIASDLQYNGVGGQLSRIVVGDSGSGYRVPKDFAYYPVAAGDVKSGYVQTLSVGSATLPDSTNPTIAVLSWGKTPDAFGRSLSETLDSKTTQFGWFGDGQLASVKTPPPNSNSHGFTFTPTTTTYAPPALTGVTNPNSVFTYNLDGQLDLVTRPDGKTVDYQYSATTGQLTAIVGDTTTGSVSFTYGQPPSCSTDFCTCLNCAAGSSPGLVSSITGPSTVQLSLGYTGPLLAQTILDKTGTTETLFKRAELDSTYTQRLLVDTESLIVNQTPPATTFQETAAFSYDPDGLPICVQQAATSCTSGQASAETIVYDSAVAVPTSTTIGKIQDTYGYNAFNDLASITSQYTTGSPPVTTQLYKVTYDDGTKNTAGSRDVLGRVQRKTEVRGVAGDAHTTVTNYTYDTSGRLWTASASVDGGTPVTHTYVYDADGNRNFTNPVYDAQDRLKSFGTGTCGSSSTETCYTYSAYGDLATKSVGTLNNTYTYDVLGNLRNVTFKSGTSTTKVIDYLVDGLGRRVGKKVGTTTSTSLAKEFVYRGNSLQIAAEIDATAGKVKSRFFYGSRKNAPDFMEFTGTTTKLYRIISDQLGSPVLVVNTQDNTDVLLDVGYDEWGQIMCHAQPNNAPDCAPDGTGPCVETKCTGVIPFGFAGGLYDADTGLVRFGARDYDPSIGRWVSKDPILFGGGQGNLYVYVGDEPIDSRDPTGLWLENIFDNSYQRGLHQYQAVTSDQFVDWAGDSSLEDLSNPGGLNSDSSGRGPLFDRYVQDPGNPDAIIDMRHFLVVGQKGELFGLGIELEQLLAGNESGFDAQDFYSNALGAQFFRNYDANRRLSDQLREFFAARRGTCGG